MWATFDLSDAREQLSTAISNRLIRNPPPVNAKLVRFPVGLFFIRGDRGGDGAKLTEQVVKSYGYWDDESSEHLDVVFFGWGKDEEQIVYDSKAFQRCKNALEGITKWRYSGETDLLLVNFEVPLKKGQLTDAGNFSFKRTIPLPVEEMIRDKRVGSLDGFMQELINHAKHLREKAGEADVWKMSDRIAFYRGRKSLWAKLRKVFLREFDQVYEEVRPFAVCDLRA